MASNSRLEPYEKKLAMDRFYDFKLSNYCLQSIVKFFDRHMLARKLSTVPARHYEFLQIKYSKKLLDDLDVVRLGWPSAYEDFFLNKHIKDITIKSLPRNMESIINRLYKIGPTLKKLDLDGSIFTEDVLCQLSLCLPNVESLTISHSPIAFEGLCSIMKHCSSLERLVLYSVHLSDEIIRDVFQIGGAQDEFACKYKLKFIDLFASNITDVGVICILNYFPNLIHGYLPNLDDIVFGTNIDNFINNISPLKTYNLTELIIHGDAYEDESNFRLCSTVCPHLIKLAISDPRAQAQIDALTSFPALREVDFDHCDETRINLSFFLEHNGKKLEVLEVASLDSLSISAKALINSCPNLRTLDMTNVEFQRIEENVFLWHKLNKLKDVRFSLNFLTPYAVESVNTILSLSPNLEALSFGSCKSVLVFINSIIDNRCLMNIRKLDISDTDLTLSGIKTVLLAFPKVEKCKIESQKFSAEEISQLVKELPTYISKVWIDDSCEDYLELHFLQAP